MNRRTDGTKDRTANGATDGPVDVSRWTRHHADKKHPFWWGILGLIAIETTVVGVFIVGYFYLWIVNVAEDRKGWPPEGTPLPPVLYPGINLALLGLCALSMYYGGKVLEKGKRVRFGWSVVFCCAVSTLVLILQSQEFRELPFSWKENAYASYVWLLTGFHSVHVTSALLGTTLIGYAAFKGFFSAQRRIGAEVVTLYWYFVAIAWAPMYLVAYLLPRWFR